MPNEHADQTADSSVALTTDQTIRRIRWHS
nr:MAG TPA: hypothetical protein [Caudoviricetes sp.]